MTILIDFFLSSTPPPPGASLSDRRGRLGSVLEFFFFRHFEVARETGTRWLSKYIVGLFLATMSKMPQNSPQCTFNEIISTRSSAQPQSGELQCIVII